MHVAQSSTFTAVEKRMGTKINFSKAVMQAFYLLWLARLAKAHYGTKQCRAVKKSSCQSIGWSAQDYAKYKV